MHAHLDSEMEQLWRRGVSAGEGWDPSFSYSNLLFWEVATVMRPSSNHVTSIGFEVIVTQSQLARLSLKVLPAFGITTMTNLPYLALGVHISACSTRYPTFPGTLVPNNVGLCQSAMTSMKKRTPGPSMSFLNGATARKFRIPLSPPFPTAH